MIRKSVNSASCSEAMDASLGGLREAASFPTRPGKALHHRLGSGSHLSSEQAQKRTDQIIRDPGTGFCRPPTAVS